MMVRIFRYKPGSDSQPHYDHYKIPIAPHDHITVMALLEHIAEEQDPDLSFYSHSTCRHGICGRCIVKVNGKPCLACQRVLDSEDIIDSITIEPVRATIAKDLVVNHTHASFST